MESISLLKLEEQAIDANVPHFTRGMLEHVMQRATTPENQLAITDEAGKVDPVKLKGAVAFELTRVLGQYSSMGSPTDVGEDDIVVSVEPMADGGQRVSANPSEYLRNVINAVGRTAMKRSVLWHRDQLAERAKEESEIIRADSVRGRKNPPPKDKPYSLVYGVTSGWIHVALPVHVKDGEMLRTGPLSEYLLKALTHCLLRRYGNTDEARALTSAYLRQGFHMALSPSLHVAVYEEIVGKGLLPFRVVESQGGTLLATVLLAGGAAGVITVKDEGVAQSKGMETYTDVLLYLASDVPSCLDVLEADMQATPEPKGPRALFAKCSAMRYAFEPTRRSTACSSVWPLFGRKEHVSWRKHSGHPRRRTHPPPSLTMATPS